MTNIEKPKPKKQNIRLYLRISADDKAAIAARAKKTHLSLSEYLRRMGLRGKITIQESQTDFTQITELNKIGVNLNQIARKLNATGQLQPHALATTLEDINRYLDEAQSL